MNTKKLNSLISELTFVIPARLKSSRVKEKVFQKLEVSDGEFISLIELKIINLLKIVDAKNIILSTGENELIEIGEKYGLTISIRAEEFYKAGYKTTTRESINEVIKDVKTKYTAWTPPVVPFHDSECILGALNYFSKNCLSEPEISLATVFEEKAYFWYNNKPLNYSPDENHVQSQFLEPLKRVTNGLYIAKTADMRANGYFLSKNILLYNVNQTNAIDIDTESDLAFARLISKEFYNEKL